MRSGEDLFGYARQDLIDFHEAFHHLSVYPFNKSFAEIGDMTPYQVRNVLFRPDKGSSSFPPHPEFPVT